MTPVHRTDYASHDAIYRRRRAAGYPGWDDEQVQREVLADLDESLASPQAPRSGQALELGCGAGDTALVLAARGFQVTGVDVSVSAIEWAREKAAAAGLSLELELGDVRRLDHLPAASFDLVLDGHCLHCLIGTDRATVLNHVRRLLAPSGRFLVRTMCGEVQDDALRAQFDPESRCQVVDGVAVRYFGTADAILQELQVAGFELLTWDVRLGQESVEGYLRAWLRATS